MSKKQGRKVARKKDRSEEQVARDFVSLFRGRPGSMKATIDFRITHEEKDAWDAAAKASGLTLSEWIRQCCTFVVMGKLKAKLESHRSFVPENGAEMFQITAHERAAAAGDGTFTVEIETKSERLVFSGVSSVAMTVLASMLQKRTSLDDRITFLKAQAGVVCSWTLKAADDGEDEARRVELDGDPIPE